MTDYPKCLYCGNPADRLKYYSKTYPNGKDTIEAPLLCCPECVDKAKQDLSIHRGGMEGIVTYSFRDIGKMKEKRIGQICGRRGYEINHLANKIWRNILFNIHYRNQPTKKEALRDNLNWYKQGVQDRITISEFNRSLSGLLDCADVILEDIK